MWCGREEISMTMMRSNFALSTIKCSAGHIPNLAPADMRGVCYGCDAELVQRVTERKQVCFEKECRRFALVDKTCVVERLGKTPLVERQVHDLLRQGWYY